MSTAISIMPPRAQAHASSSTSVTSRASRALVGARLRRGDFSVSLRRNLDERVTAQSRRGTLLGLTAMSRAVHAMAGTEAAEAESESSSQDDVDDQVVLGGVEDPSTCPITRMEHKGRIVAIGDLHGDLRKTLMALKVAGVVEEKNGRPVWIGGDALVIQMGDILDRGDNEIAIISLLREVGRMAKDEGGDVIILNGNHESLNVAGDFRYVTPGAFFESAIAAGLKGEQAYEFDYQLQARFALWAPGGPLARELAKNPSVLIVNDTVFVHGGLTVEHVNYGLERLNLEVAQWMRGDMVGEGGRPAPPPFLAMGDQSSVMWNRTFSKERFPSPRDKFLACSQLKEALEAVGCERMVVGHTPQFMGCNCECNKKVWRIDVGMSAGVLDARPEVLELVWDEESGESEVRIVAAARADPVTTSPTPNII